MLRCMLLSEFMHFRGLEFAFKKEITKLNAHKSN